MPLEFHGQRSLVSYSPWVRKESDTTKAVTTTTIHRSIYVTRQTIPYLYLYNQTLLWLSGKESTCQCRGRRFDPWVGKVPWRRKWQPTPIFLPGKSHGQRSPAGYNHGVTKRVGHDLVTKQQQK